jgi:hypothetical protein
LRERSVRLVAEAMARSLAGSYGLPGPMLNNFRPNRTCCPFPSHLSQGWCA